MTLVLEQRDDHTIKRLIALKEEGDLPSLSEKKKDSQSVQYLLREWEKLELHDEGVLYYKRVVDGELAYQLVLPSNTIKWSYNLYMS